MNEEHLKQTVKALFYSPAYRHLVSAIQSEKDPAEKKALAVAIKAQIAANLQRLLTGKEK